MARETITAQSKPSSNPVAVTELAFTSANDNGDGYQVTANGTLMFAVWNNGVTGDATFTISGTAVTAWQNRTSDITTTIPTGDVYIAFVPPEGFNNGGYVYFNVGGTGADDVDIAIVKNM